jgi:plasmid stabilization system protein ParE
MRRLAVEILPAVEASICEQVVYIAQDSIDRALAWEVRLRTMIEDLADFHGHAVDHATSRRLGEEVRKVVFEKTYLVYYRIRKVEGLVEVINVRHGARLPRRNEP